LDVGAGFDYLGIVAAKTPGVMFVTNTLTGDGLVVNKGVVPYAIAWGRGSVSAKQIGIR